MNWKIHALKQIFKTFFLVICILESKFIYYAIGNYLYRLHRSILHLLQTQHRRDWEAVLNKIIHLISTCTIQYKTEFQQRLTGDHLISNEINWPDAMVYWGFLGCFSISSNSSMICENKKQTHTWMTITTGHYLFQYFITIHEQNTILECSKIYFLYLQ